MIVKRIKGKLKEKLIKNQEIEIIDYVSYKEKATFLCKKHKHHFKQFPGSFTSGKIGCEFCKANIIKKNTSKYFTKFKSNCEEIHNNQFDYSESEYINKLTEIKIFCKKHKVYFYQTPQSHQRGRVSCPHCLKSRKSNSKFLEQCKSTHGEKYDYSLVEYEGMFVPIDIICKKHGIFKSKPRNHLNRKSGCPKCAREKQKISKEYFIQKSNEVHGNLFNYSEVKYIDTTTPVKIICPNNHVTWQKPEYHMQGNGCKYCTSQISKKETKWLDMIGIDQSNRNVLIKISKKIFKVDALVGKNIYEFYGDFWHGNPKIFSEHEINPVTKTKYSSLYNKTIEREKFLKKFGYNVISIWESEFDKLST